MSYSTGEVYPKSAWLHGDGHHSWVNDISYAYTQNDSGIRSDLNTSDRYSDRVTLYSGGMGVPDGAIITRVDVKVRKKQSGTVDVHDSYVCLAYGGDIGNNVAVATKTPQSYGDQWYGGDPESYWGVSGGLTSDHVNNSLFGAVYEAYNGSTYSPSAYLDTISITVTYELNENIGVADVCTCSDDLTVGVLSNPSEAGMGSESNPTIQTSLLNYEAGGAVEALNEKVSILTSQSGILTDNLILKNFFKLTGTGKGEENLIEHLFSGVNDVGATGDQLEELKVGVKTGDTGVEQIESLGLKVFNSLNELINSSEWVGNLTNHLKITQTGVGVEAQSLSIKAFLEDKNSSTVENLKENIVLILSQPARVTDILTLNVHFKLQDTGHSSDLSNIKALISQVDNGVLSESLKLSIATLISQTLTVDDKLSILNHIAPLVEGVTGKEALTEKSLLKVVQLGSVGDEVNLGVLIGFNELGVLSESLKLNIATVISELISSHELLSLEITKNPLFDVGGAVDKVVERAIIPVAQPVQTSENLKLKTYNKLTEALNSLEDFNLAILTSVQDISNVTDNLLEHILIPLTESLKGSEGLIEKMEIPLTQGVTGKDILNLKVSTKLNDNFKSSDKAGVHVKLIFNQLINSLESFNLKAMTGVISESSKAEDSIKEHSEIIIAQVGSGEDGFNLKVISKQFEALTGADEISIATLTHLLDNSTSTENIKQFARLLMIQTGAVNDNFKLNVYNQLSESLKGSDKTSLTALMPIIEGLQVEEQIKQGARLLINQSATSEDGFKLSTYNRLSESSTSEDNINNHVKVPIAQSMSSEDGFNLKVLSQLLERLKGSENFNLKGLIPLTEFISSSENIPALTVKTGLVEVGVLTDKVVELVHLYLNGTGKGSDTFSFNILSQIMDNSTSEESFNLKVKALLNEVLTVDDYAFIVGSIQRITDEWKGSELLKEWMSLKVTQQGNSSERLLLQIATRLSESYMGKDSLKLFVLAELIRDTGFGLDKPALIEFPEVGDVGIGEENFSLKLKAPVSDKAGGSENIFLTVEMLINQLVEVQDNLGINVHCKADDSGNSEEDLNVGVLSQLYDKIVGSESLSSKVAFQLKDFVHGLENNPALKVKTALKDAVLGVENFIELVRLQVHQTGQTGDNLTIRNLTGLSENSTSTEFLTPKVKTRVNEVLTICDYFTIKNSLPTLYDEGASEEAVKEEVKLVLTQPVKGSENLKFNVLSQLWESSKVEDNFNLTVHNKFIESSTIQDNLRLTVLTHLITTLTSTDNLNLKVGSKLSETVKGRDSLLAKVKTGLSEVLSVCDIFTIRNRLPTFYDILVGSEGLTARVKNCLAQSVSSTEALKLSTSNRLQDVSSGVENVKLHFTTLLNEASQHLEELSEEIFINNLPDVGVGSENLREQVKSIINQPARVWDSSLVSNVMSLTDLYSLHDSLKILALNEVADKGAGESSLISWVANKLKESPELTDNFNIKVTAGLKDFGKVTDFIIAWTHCELMRCALTVFGPPTCNITVGAGATCNITLKQATVSITAKQPVASIELKSVEEDDN